LGFSSCTVLHAQPFGPLIWIKGNSAANRLTQTGILGDSVFGCTDQAIKSLLGGRE